MVKILVVDDSTVDRTIAGGLLEKHENWQAEYAVDGREGLAKIEADRPDVIVTDLQMPEMNGLELVQEVKNKFPLVPIILMTAQGSEVIAVEALQQGASSYVPKVQLTELLVETVEQVLILAGEKKSKQSLMRCLDRTKSRFILSNEPPILSSLVSHLQGLVRDMELLSETDRLRVGVALEEALLNASYHGNLEVSSKLRETDHAQYYELARQRLSIAPYSSRSIYVDIEIDSSGLKYTIEDEGPGFDPTTLPDPTDPANLEKPCGRGLLLMRTFMDDIQYNEKGNRVVMTKKVQSETD